MSIAAETYHRVIDPWTNRSVASWGWIRRGNGLPDEYWVSIEDQPIRFFSRRDWADEFYYEKTRLLRARLNQRRKRGPQQRASKYAARVAVAGR